MHTCCPLCFSSNTALLLEDSLNHAPREYFRCLRCLLVFVPRAFHLSAEAEKSQYDLHQNLPLDPGYRAFLGKLFAPLEPRLPRKAKGLDFGCGPGPTLALMFAERGHQMRVYDPFYAPDVSVLAGGYDFITATEVAEHLSQPGAELDKLWGLLSAGGWLAIMTRFVGDIGSFAGWHYRRDPTHISFFSRETFAWLGGQWGVAPEFIGNDVVIFAKN